MLAVAALATDEGDMARVESSSEAGLNEDLGLGGNFNLSYFGVFFGPTLKSPSSYQVDSNGDPDPNRPLIMKNFVDLSYHVTSDVSVTGTFYWIW